MTGERRASHEAADKPDSPGDLTKQSWFYVARKTVREFSDDQCTDLAAALTYYSVLALFPAAIAMLSLVGLVGQGPKTVDTLLQILRDVGASSAADTLEPTLTQLSNTPNAGLALIIGLAAALWSASGYVGAFGRGMNRIYEIDEGRPIWKLRPMMLLVTLITVVLTALVALGLVLTGPAAQAVGDAIGLGSTVVTVWNIAKWPVLLAVVVLIVALLYYATPNVKQPKFRWISVGAVVAILVWVARLGRVRVLRRELLQLQQDLRLPGRRHRVPALAVDHQPRAAVRRRARRRARARPRAPGRHARRGDHPAPRPRHPQERQGRREGARRHRPRSAPATQPRRPTRTRPGRGPDGRRPVHEPAPTKEGRHEV